MFLFFVVHELSACMSSQRSTWAMTLPTNSQILSLAGDEANTSADAEALLHEYKHISSMGTDDLKVNEKIPGILDIVE